MLPVAAFSGEGEKERGVRIGFDLSSAALSFMEGEGIDAGFTADMTWGDDYFIIADAGYVNHIRTGPGYELSQDALYTRAGVDYSIYSFENDVIATGFRYGFSTYRHKGKNVLVEDDYWGDYRGIMPANNLRSHWIEGVFSLKTELFADVFIGWTLRGKVLLQRGEEENMEEWHIPGYGLSGQSSTLGFNFYIFYRIPF